MNPATAFLAPPPRADPPPSAPPLRTTTAVLEARIHHRTDAISRLTSLFTEHGFNLDAIIGVPISGGAQCRLLLLVNNEPRLAEIPALLEELPDVIAVHHRRDLTSEFFLWMAEMAAGSPVAGG